MGQTSVKGPVCTPRHRCLDNTGRNVSVVCFKVPQTEQTKKEWDRERWLWALESDVANELIFTADRKYLFNL